MPRLACAAALAISLCALAAEPAAEPTTQPVAQSTQPSTQPSDSLATLLAQLDDPDFGTREFAEAKLDALGPTIEPGLKAALSSNLSDEARARIYHLLRQFEEARELHASITMHYAQAPAMTVLNDFAAQAGSSMGIDDSSIATAVQGKLVSINLDNAGFWDSLRAINDATGLTPYLGQGGVTFSGGGRVFSEIDLTKPYVHSSGGILIEPFQSQFNRTRNLIGSATFPAGFINFQVNVIPEPRMHVIGMMAGNWVRQCIDDKGNSLALESPNRRFFLPRMIPMRGPRQWQFPLVANFREFPGIGTRIAKLVGELNLSVETKGLTTQIPNITRAANTTKDDGELAVTVLSCDRTNVTYQIELLVRGAAMNDPVYQGFFNTIELLDDKGHAIPRQNIMPRPVPDGIRITLLFVPTATPPSSLKWERTLEQKKVVVPFEIDDLPPW